MPLPSRFLGPSRTQRMDLQRVEPFPEPPAVSRFRLTRRETNFTRSSGTRQSGSPPGVSELASGEVRSVAVSVSLRIFKAITYR